MPTRCSHSRVESFNRCPFKYFLRYVERLDTIPNMEPDNALILGTALHTGIEEDVDQALEFYTNSFPILTDDHIHEMMKLEALIPKAKALLPPGGTFELPIGNSDFIGFMDYLAPVDEGTFDLYDFKYSSNSKSYILYDWPEDEIQDLPKWLTPVKTSMKFLDMRAGDGRNQALFNYILTLQSEDFTKEEARETIRLINRYVLDEPLSDRELETILRDEAFKKPIFFKDKTFLFDKFAVYLKNNNHMRRNAEMFTVAETMIEALNFITLPGGDLLHGTSVNYEVVDNVLHFFVNFNLPMIRPADETMMETLETEVGTVGGD